MSTSLATHHIRSFTQTSFEIFGIKSTLYNNALWVPLINSIKLDKLINNYSTKNNDVFILTYPKCGTTLTIHICYEIMSQLYNSTKSINHEYYNKQNKNINSSLYTPQYLTWLASENSNKFKNILI